MDACLGPAGGASCCSFRTTQSWSTLIQLGVNFCSKIYVKIVSCFNMFYSHLFYYLFCSTVFTLCWQYCWREVRVLFRPTWTTVPSLFFLLYTWIKNDGFPGLPVRWLNSYVMSVSRHRVAFIDFIPSTLWGQLGPNQCWKSDCLLSFHKKHFTLKGVMGIWIEFWIEFLSILIKSKDTFSEKKQIF